MVRKITYSRYGTGKRRMPFDEESAQYDNSSRKRSKADESDRLRFPPTPPPSRQGKHSSLLKKGLKGRAHSGPVSIPDEEMDIGPAPKRIKNLSVFDKVLQGQSQTVNAKQHNIYGSRQDFAETMKDERKRRQNSSYQRNGYLPTPPAESHSAMKAHQEARRKQNFPNANGSTFKPVLKVQNTLITSTKTSEPVEQVSIIDKIERPKEPYKPKAYEAEKTTAPRKTILGVRLSKKLKEAQMWSTNQTDSPLLRLPGEIRNLIYEYALGGNTINIGFETYRTTYEAEKPHKVVPIFKYYSTVYNHRTNPFSNKNQPYINVSTGFTPLNNVCRQMYLEAATLPYKLNLLSFASHNIMFNLLFMERRLSHQQLDAITTVILPDTLPQPNMLNYLRKLEKVFLGVDRKETDKGWYRVVRREGEEPKLVDTRSR